jgi:glycosyltransferase involved in cell wall biosynthesis
LALRTRTERTAMSSRTPGDLVVDIVINNHNYGAFLTEAIESALAQTHRNVNVLVVDDGSTDDSREILQGHDERVAVVLKENGGQASAVNTGMAHCNSDIVMFLDADDVLRPEAAARVAAAFALDETVAKVQFRMDVIDAEGRQTGAIKPAPHLQMPQGDLRSAELAFPFDIPWMAMSANAFRTEALRRIIPIPAKDYPISGADWYLVHLAALLGRVVSIEDVFASYRVHGSNNYEPQEAELSLAHVRKAIDRTLPTSKALLSLARDLNLPHPDRILSLADLANRLTSLRLEPARHPVPDDRVGALVIDAVRAARRRSDISPAMKFMFVTWFAAMAVAPRRLAARLAVLFLFPERRTLLNPLLERLQARTAKLRG